MSLIFGCLAGFTFVADPGVPGVPSGTTSGIGGTSPVSLSAYHEVKTGPAIKSLSGLTADPSSGDPSAP